MLSAVFIRQSRSTADKTFAALRQVRTQDKILLASRSADMACAAGFCVHLAEEVHIHRIVDGNEVIQLRNRADIIGMVT